MQHVAEAVAFLQGETAKQKAVFDEKTSSLETEMVHMQWLRQQVVLLERERKKLAKDRDSKFINVGGSPILKEKYFDLLQENESLKFQIASLKDENRNEEENADKPKEASKMSLDEEECSDEDNSSNPDDIVDGPAEKNDQGLRLKIGEHYALVSDRKFFDIDWCKEYECTKQNRTRCKSCLVVRARSSTMKDHVWCKHYGGGFLCPYCVGPDRRFSSRDTVKKHIQRAHD